jgi:hypothetical protein
VTDEHGHVVLQLCDFENGGIDVRAGDQGAMIHAEIVRMGGTVTVIGGRMGPNSELLPWETLGQ